MFWHAGRDITTVVHGDDFVLVGEEEDLRWVSDLIQGWFEVKIRAMLGEDRGDDKVVEILGRTVRWTSQGVEFEADPTHRRNIMKYFGILEFGAKDFSQNLTLLCIFVFIIW